MDVCHNIEIEEAKNLYKENESKMKKVYKIDVLRFLITKLLARPFFVFLFFATKYKKHWPPTTTTRRNRQRGILRDNILKISYFETHNI